MSVCVSIFILHNGELYPLCSYKLGHINKLEALQKWQSIIEYSNSKFGNRIESAFEFLTILVRTQISYFVNFEGKHPYLCSRYRLQRPTTTTLPHYTHNPVGFASKQDIKARLATGRWRWAKTQVYIVYRQYRQFEIR